MGKFHNSKWHQICTCPICNACLPVNFLLYGVDGLFEKMTIRFFAKCEHCKQMYEWDGLERLALIQESWETEIDAMFREYGSEECFFKECLEEFLWRFEQFGTVEPFSPIPLQG
jgi:hypothetical protein